MTEEAQEQLLEDQQTQYDTLAREEFVRAGYRQEVRRLRREVKALAVVSVGLTLAVIWIAII